MPYICFSFVFTVLTALAELGSRSLSNPKFDLINRLPRASTDVAFGAGETCAVGGHAGSESKESDNFYAIGAEGRLDADVALAKKVPVDGAVFGFGFGVDDDKSRVCEFACLLANVLVFINKSRVVGVGAHGNDAAPLAGTFFYCVAGLSQSRAV